MAQVKMLRIDSNPEDVQEFEIEHAQRILDLRYPIKTWKLKDPAYKMDKGQIVAVEVKAPEVKK